MPEILPSIALFAAGGYWGAAAYVALVEHPARLACPTDAALAQWTESLPRTPRYAALALVAAAAALMHGRAAIDSPWTWGAVLLLAVLPWTVVAMLPAQRRLTDSRRNMAALETRPALEQWGRRHLVRVLFGVVAFALFVWAR